MKVTKYLPILAVCLMTTGCNSKKEAVLTSGIDLANLDTTAMPGTSFYQYACGGWVKDHPLTDEYSRFGTFDMLRENSREQLKALIAELAAKKDNAPGSAAQKIGDLYNIAMDSTTILRRSLLTNVSFRPFIQQITGELVTSGITPAKYHHHSFIRS